MQRAKILAYSFVKKSPASILPFMWQFID